MRWRRGCSPSPVSLLAAAFVGLSAAGGWFYWERVRDPRRAVGARGAAAVGRQGDPRGVRLRLPDRRAQPGRRVPVADAGLSPGVREERQRRRSSRRPRSARSSCRPMSSAWESWRRKRNSASVMVYMNRTVTDKSRQPLYDGSRLRVDLQADRRQMADQLHHADLAGTSRQRHCPISLQSNG